jgi:hypothetical protein
MSDHELVRLVMQEVGPRDDEILEVLQTGDQSWAARFADVDIELELEPETRRLMLSAEIGAPPEETRASIYETMLLYNLLGSDTGGVHMALSEAGGAVVQMVDLHCSALTTELLVTVLHNLNERTLIWREFFAGGAEQGETVAPPPPFEHPMIQV